MNILDRLFPAKVAPTSAGKSPSVTLVSIDDTTYRFNLQSITPGQIISAKQMFRYDGRLLLLDQLYSLLIEEDDNVSGRIETRAEALKSKWPVISSSELSEQQVKFFTDLSNRLYPEIVDLVIDFKMRGYCFRQIEYAMEDNLYTINGFADYENLDLRVVAPTSAGKNVPTTSGKSLQLFKDEVLQNLPPLQFIQLYSKKSILKSLLKYYVFFSFALENWASFTEIFGKPLRVGKYKPGATASEKSELWNMLTNAGGDLAAMISENMAMEFIQHSATSASSDLYKNLCNFCKDAVTTRILGQTLTTGVGDKGSFALGNVHDAVRKDILAGDARDAELLCSNLYTRLNNINFNTNRVEVTIPIEDEPSPLEKADINLKRAQTDVILTRDLNVKLDEDYFYTTYERARPGETK